MRFGLCISFLLAALTPCPGKEVVYLTTGFTLEIQSHTQGPQSIVCQTTTGTLELQMSDVDRIEVLPDTPVQTAPSTPRPVDVLAEAAIAQGLPLELIRSVAKVESGLRQDAVSAKGGIGLMQLMPRTAAELGVEPGLAEENAQGGAKYLRDLLLRYHYDSALALAAYNAGPGAVDKYHGVPPYLETRQYVLKVLHEYQKLERRTGAAKRGN